MKEELLLSLSTALIVGILAFIGTVWGTNKTVRATTVSNNRQEWINRLRDEIAGFLVYPLEDLNRYQATSGDEASYPKILEKSTEATSHALTIGLLINPNEIDHSSLYDQIIQLKKECDVLLVKMYDSRNSENSFRGEFLKTELRVTEILTLSQKILKREWERVKDGK